MDPFTRQPFPVRSREALCSALTALSVLTHPALQPEVFSPVAGSALRALPLRAPVPQRRVSIADFFSPPTRKGAGSAVHCVGASTGRKRASFLAPASASAEPSADAADEAEDAVVAVPPSSVKRARNTKGARFALCASRPPCCILSLAARFTAAAVCDSVAGMLHGIFGGVEPTPARTGALSIYADAPPGSADTGGTGSPVSEAPSPAKPHPMAWGASRPLLRPLQPLGNLSKRLAQAAEEPPQPCAPKARVSSRFFGASPAAAVAEPVAEPASATAPAMGADVRHCAAFAAAAASALDAFRHGGGSARKPASAKRARGAAAATPMLRALAEVDASPAVATSLDAFRFTPRAL